MITRLATAAFLVWLAFLSGGKAPNPNPVPDVKPMPRLIEEVRPVSEILRNAEIYDRMIFASVFEQCADAAEDKLTEVRVTFENTLGLQVFTQQALRVAWARIADASGKYPGLNDAVEQLFTDLLGTEIEPITPETLKNYADLCRALAYAGMPGDE
jgi:hypothetical protein